MEADMSATRDAVQERYRSAALRMSSQSSGCCGSDCCGGSTTDQEACGTSYTVVDAGFESPEIEITGEQDVEGLPGAIGNASIRARKPASAQSLSVASRDSAGPYWPSSSAPRCWWRP
jgi:hypothetical protein